MRTSLASGRNTEFIKKYLLLWPQSSHLDSKAPLYACFSTSMLASRQKRAVFRRRGILVILLVCLIQHLLRNAARIPHCNQNADDGKAGPYEMIHVDALGLGSLGNGSADEKVQNGVGHHTEHEEDDELLKGNAGEGEEVRVRSVGNRHETQEHVDLGSLVEQGR